MRRALEERESAGPAALSPEDEALIAAPAAAAAWAWLKRRFAGRTLDLDMSPQLDLGIESLGWVDLTLAIERDLGVSLREQEIARIVTLARSAARDRGRRRGRTAAGTPAEIRPDVVLAPLGPVERGLRALVEFVAWAVMRLGFRLRVEGRENLPRARAVSHLPQSRELSRSVRGRQRRCRTAMLRETYWAGWTGILYTSRLRRLFSRVTQVVPVDLDRAAGAEHRAWRRGAGARSDSGLVSRRRADAGRQPAAVPARRRRGGAAASRPHRPGHDQRELRGVAGRALVPAQVSARSPSPSCRRSTRRRSPALDPQEIADAIRRAIAAAQGTRRDDPVARPCPPCRPLALGRRCRRRCGTRRRARSSTGSAARSGAAATRRSSARSRRSIRSPARARRRCWAGPSGSIRSRRRSSTASPRAIADYDDTHLATVIHPTGPAACALLALVERHRDERRARSSTRWRWGSRCSAASPRALAPTARGALVHDRRHRRHRRRGRGRAACWASTRSACCGRSALAASRAAGAARDARHDGEASRRRLRRRGGARSRAFLAQQGFGAPEAPIEGRRGLGALVAPGADFAALTDGLGTSFELMRNAYKPFPSGIVTHAAITAALELAREAAPDPDAIAAVRLAVHPMCLELCGRRTPASALEGTFSVYHWVAVALIRSRDRHPAILATRWCAIRAIAALRERIEARAEPAYRKDEAEIEIDAARRPRAPPPCRSRAGRGRAAAERRRADTKIGRSVRRPAAA